MIASLGMYDRAETRQSNDALWAAIRDELGFGPEELDHTSDLWDIWTSPDLLLAQTCGLPFRSKLNKLVKLVGTPDYALPGCPAGYYNSVFLTRKGDETTLEHYQNRTFAYNEALSQSGWAAAQTHAGKHRFQFENLHLSGSHQNSARAVASGRADIAALDAVTWRLLRKYNAFSANLQVIETTAPTPGLPLITGTRQDARKIQAAVRTAIKRFYPIYRRVLGIQGIIHIPAADYLAIPTPPGPGALAPKSNLFT